VRNGGLDQLVREGNDDDDDSVDVATDDDDDDDYDDDDDVYDSDNNSLIQVLFINVSSLQPNVPLEKQHNILNTVLRTRVKHKKIIIT
jgi:hypothetical protein